MRLTLQTVIDPSLVALAYCALKLADNVLKCFSDSFQKTGPDISYKLSPKEIICMKFLEKSIKPVTYLSSAACKSADLFSAPLKF